MSSKKGKKEIPADKLALYEKLVEATAGVELKKNFGFPYTAFKSNMYSLISKTGSVGIRLPKTEREAFLEKYGTTLYEHMPGAPLKEYVTVPDELLKNTGTLKPYMAISHQYVQTLKPKPAKKKK